MWRTSSHSVTACVELVEAVAVDLRREDLSGVRLALSGIGELTAELARLVAEHNGIAPPAPGQDDPFRMALEALPGTHMAGRLMPDGTASFLEKGATRMLSTSGLPIPLPRTSDGLPQSVTVFLHGTAERIDLDFARDHVDSRYEIHYSVGSGVTERRDVRTVEIHRGLGLLPLSPTARGKRPATPWFGKPAFDGAPSSPSSSFIRPSRSMPPATASTGPSSSSARLEGRRLADVTAMANLAIDRYLKASSSGQPGSRRLSPEGINELFGKLPPLLQKLPQPELADRIAQARLNQGTPVTFPGAGFGQRPQSPSDSGSSRTLDDAPPTNGTRRPAPRPITEDEVDMTDADWRKSLHSEDEDACVEAASVTRADHRSSTVRRSADRSGRRRS